MFSRFIPIVFLCVLLGVSTADAQTNKLLNPSFESPELEASQPESWVTNGVDGIFGVTWATVAYDGSWYVRRVTNGFAGPTAVGHVAQSFAVVSGITYDATAYMAGDWITGTPSSVQGRIGLDPTGQTSDVGAASIQWSDWVSLATEGVWLPITKSLAATGSTMSLFCQGNFVSLGDFVQNVGQWAQFGIDAAVVPGEAPPTPTPTPVIGIESVNLGLDDPFIGGFNNHVPHYWRAWWIEAATTETPDNTVINKPEQFERRGSGLSGQAQWIWDGGDNYDAGIHVNTLIDMGSLYRLSGYFFKTEGTAAAADRLVNIGVADGEQYQSKTDRSPAAFPDVAWASELEGGPTHSPGLDFNGLGASDALDQWFQIYTPLIEATGSDVTLFLEVLSTAPGDRVDFYIDQLAVQLTSTSVEEDHWSLFR